MKKRSHMLIGVFLLSLLLSGCWDRQELEKKAYVIAMGMDTSKQDNKIRITYQIANPEVGSQQQGGSSNEPADEIITFVTNDLVSAMNTANIVIAKQISYDLLGTIIVSKDFASSSNFIRWIYDATKSMEIRRDTKLIVTKEDASTFILENNPKMETRPHVYFNTIMQRAAETALIPKGDLLKFFRITEADADLFLAAYASVSKADIGHSSSSEDQFSAGQFSISGETNKANFIGSAVFKEGQMIGTLTGEETRIATLLNATLHASDMLVTYPDPFSEKHRITTRIRKNKPNNVVMKLDKAIPEIHVMVPLSMDVLSNHSMVDYSNNREKRQKLKHQIDKAITKKMNKLVKRTQEEFKTEPFGWSLIARKKFLTIPAYENFDWMKSYPEMKITIEIKIKFASFGRQGELPTKKKVRD